MRSCKHEKNAILMNILEWNFIHNALCWSDNSRLWLLLGRPWFNFVTCKILQREKTVRIFKEKYRPFFANSPRHQGILA